MPQASSTVFRAQSTVANLTISRKIPIYVFLELTRLCNLRCRHCYLVKEKKAELSTEEIKEVIRQLRNENALILNFSGGEVFERQDFFDISEYAKELNFGIKIFTNGTLIDDLKAARLAKLKPLRVEISIYSLDPEVHDSITGVEGSLEKSLNALCLLRSHKIPLRIKTPLMKNNFSGYRRIIELAKRLGAKYQFDPNIIPKLDGDKSVLCRRIGKKNLIQLLRDPAIRANEDSMTRGGGQTEGLSCSAGHNSCAINAYGEVQPCAILPIKLGSLRKNDFCNIWKNSPELNCLRSVRMSDLKVCSKCSLLACCARCPGLAYLETGNILGVSRRNCFVSKINSGLWFYQ